MRIIKQRLIEMLPDASVFLDVDDLKSGRGAEYALGSSAWAARSCSSPYSSFRFLSKTWTPATASALSHGPASKSDDMWCVLRAAESFSWVGSVELPGEGQLCGAPRGQPEFTAVVGRAIVF